MNDAEHKGLANGLYFGRQKQSEQAQAGAQHIIVSWHGEA